MTQEEAKNVLKEMYGKALFSERTALEVFFPDFKESEDEKVRKALLESFEYQIKESHPNKEWVCGVKLKEIVAWLEKVKDFDKQLDEAYQTTNAVVYKKGYDDGYLEGISNAKKELEKQGEIEKISYEIAEKEKREFVGDGFIKCHADFQDFKEGETYWLEYVGNDNYNVRSDNLLGKTYHITPCQLYTIFKRQTRFERQGEQNSVDKLEPKFKVGDWAVNQHGHIRQIIDIKDDCYYCIRTESPDSIENPWHGTVSYVDEQWHEWSIQDAKDGDVLVTTFEEDNKIVMYHSMYTRDTIIVHCRLDNKFVCWNPGIFDAEDVKPATKEQRDLLFQKMKEAGYQWNPEKKEIRVIITNGGDFEPELGRQEVTKKSEQDKPTNRTEEDEKSKKWILEYLYDGLRKSDEQFKDQFKAAIAWLEKQGEEKSQSDSKKLSEQIKDFEGEFGCWNSAQDFRPKHLQRCLCYDKCLKGVYCYVYDDISKYWCTQTTEEHDQDGDNHICEYIDNRVTVWMQLPDTPFYPSKSLLERQDAIKDGNSIDPHFGKPVTIAKMVNDFANGDLQPSLLEIDAYQRGISDILEKQGENIYNKELSELLHKVICKFINDPDIPYSDREKVSMKVLPYVELLEKQGEQSKEVTYTHEVETGNGNIKALVTEKVQRPKFKVGDWIVNDYCSGRVVKLTDDAYLLDTEQGMPFSCEHNIHLWTIQDAKDGDILATPPIKGSENDVQIFIFKGINNRDYADNCIEYYCRVCERVFYENKTGFMGTTSNTFYPATKEQRELLFQKMEENGYAWDAEKKELSHQEVTKKSEQDNWSEEQLNASKDERIRKEIIALIVNESSLTFDAGGFTKEELIAYLEKQKKLSHQEVTKKSEHDGKKWIDEKVYWKDREELFEDGKQEVINNPMKYGLIKDENHIADDSKKVEPKVWSEEDERILKATINTVLISRSSCEEDDEIKDRYDDELRWLKSIKDRVHPKPQWTEEDERILKQVTSFVRREINEPTSKSTEDWLKSIKERLL